MTEVPPNAWPSPSGYACPNCGTLIRLDPTLCTADGMVTCTCGHQVYAGYVAEATAIQQRLGWLRARIAASDPAPSPEIARQYSIWPAPTTAMPTPPKPGVSTQTLLLTLGAALLIIAATVFAAVNWKHLGVIGQAVLLGVATVGLASLAIRLHDRLAATAEALAVVAVGLAVVDIIGAPKLGLVPEQWFDTDRLYLVVAFAALAAALLALARRFGLQAWVWLGWLGVALAAGLTSGYVGHRLGGSAAQWSAAFGIMAVAGIALLTLAQRSGGLPTAAGSVGTGAVALLATSARSERSARSAQTLAGSVALAVGAAVIAAGALQHKALPGALGAIVGVGAASLLASRQAPSFRLACRTALVLLGAVALALVLQLPNDPQPVLLGAGAGLAGAAMAAVVARYRTTLFGFTAATVLWGLWSAGRLAAGAADNVDGGIVRRQLAWLAGIAAVALLLGAARSAKNTARHLGWPATAVAQVSWALAHPSWAPHVLETWTVPVGGLLLLAGFLASRHRTASSMVRFGLGITVALVPSALAAWNSPWVQHTSAPAREHLVRLLLVLAFGVTLACVGAMRHKAGLVLPGAAAVLAAGSAQVWTSVAALPRWIALALAGALLLGAGARLEWLRRTGDAASGWLHGLD